MTGLRGPNSLSGRAGRRWMRGGREGRGESITEREHQRERWRNDGVLLWLQAIPDSFTSSFFDGSCPALPSLVSPITACFSFNPNSFTSSAGSGAHYRQLCYTLKNVLRCLTDCFTRNTQLFFLFSFCNTFYSASTTSKIANLWTKFKTDQALAPDIESNHQLLLLSFNSPRIGQYSQAASATLICLPSRVVLCLCLQSHLQ